METNLRQIALFTAALALFATPAFAAWETYTNEPLGYSVMFPGKPKEGTGVYRSDLAPNAATHYATLKDGNSTFISTEIDTGRVDDGAILMGEFEYWLGHFGDIRLDNVSRLTQGMEYGRFLSIDCRDDIIPEGPNQTVRAHQMFKDAAGLVCPNGARVTVNLFFTQGRMYAIMGMREGDDAKTSNEPGRFANSIAWVGKNAEHARTLVDRSARQAAQQGAAGASTR